MSGRTPYVYRFPTSMAPVVEVRRLDVQVRNSDEPLLAKRFYGITTAHAMRRAMRWVSHRR